MSVRLLLIAAIAAIASTAFVGGASAALTPREETWTTKVVTIYNRMQSDVATLNKQFAQSDIFVRASATQQSNIKTLYDLTLCARKFQAAGSAPTDRLVKAGKALTAACTAFSLGAHEIAKGIGLGTKDVTAGKSLSADATTLLKKGIADVGAGKTSLAALRTLLVKVSGQSAFSA